MADGSLTTTVATEQTIGTYTDAGYYELHLDLSNMALGDVIIVSIHLKVRSSGTTRLYRECTFAHPQGQPVLATLPVTVMNEVVFKVHHTDGTSISIPWEVSVEDSA